jgi:LacI family transcriptional regulator
MSFQRNILLALRWYHPKIHRGVARYARQAGWHLNAHLARIQTGCVNWDGDGIVTQHMGNLPVAAPMDRLLAELSQPRVELGRHVQGKEEEIGQLAAEHFQDMGFSHVASLNLSTDQANPLPRRLAAFERKAKAFANISSLQVEDAPWPERRDALLAQIRALPKPVAIFALEDDTGAWVIETCRFAGIAVPDEVAVLGVRNDELVCDALAVPLSSVENNLEEQGYRAAAMLDRHLDGEDLPERPFRVSPYGVVVRQSTDILAIDHPQVLRAVQFIRQNLSESLSVKDVVGATGMCQRSLYNAFRAYLGRGIHEQILHERLRLAKARLLAGEDTIECVAQLSGFSDARHLHRIFRQALGTTPRLWVKSHRP